MFMKLRVMLASQCPKQSMESHLGHKLNPGLATETFEHAQFDRRGKSSEGVVPGQPRTIRGGQNDVGHADAVCPKEDRDPSAPPGW